MTKRKTRHANSRRKGAQGELDAARILKGKKISRTGERSADVEDPYADQWEVKRRRSRFTEIYSFINQNRDLTYGKVMMRDDRKEWLVVMPVQTFLNYYQKGKQDDNDTS